MSSGDGAAAEGTATGVFASDQASAGHQLARRVEAGEDTEFGCQGGRGHDAEARQALDIAEPACGLQSLRLGGVAYGLDQLDDLQAALKLYRLWQVRQPEMFPEDDATV